MIKRVMTPYFHFKQNSGYPPIDPSEVSLNGFFGSAATSVEFPLGSEADVDVRDHHSTLIRELGAAGTVLLKNVDGALPLKAPKNIAVLGNDAGDVVDGLYFSGGPFQSQFGYGNTPSLVC